MEKAEFWAEHIRRREERGITRKAYCAEAGLSLWQWSYWQRKLRVKVKGMVRVGVSASERFVPVRPDRESGSIGGCEFVYPSGVRIRLSDLPPPSWVRQVV